MSGNIPSAQKEFDEIKAKYGELLSLYKKHFPKVDPHLVEDLVAHGDSSGDGNDRLYAVQGWQRTGPIRPRPATIFCQRPARRRPNMKTAGTMC